MLKNTPGQYWRVFAFNVITGLPVNDDEANITARIGIDGAATIPLADLQPSRVVDGSGDQEPGYYLFELTQAETNGDELSIYPDSTTPGVEVIGAPSTRETEVPGPFTGPNAVTITVVADDTGLPIELANVMVYRTGYTRSQLTYSGGATIFTLATAVWSGVIVANGYTTQEFTLDVSAAVSVTYRMIPDGAAPAADPTKCTVQVRTIDQHKRPVPRVSVTAKLKSRQSFVGDSIVLHVPITVTTDDNGHADLPLIRGNQFVLGTGIYEFELKHAGRTYKFQYETPDQASAIATLLV